MKYTGIIPARYASSRFPGKPLVMIDGKSMIMRVYEQAIKVSGFDQVVVATDDEAIFNHVKKQGGKVMMTSSQHGSGTERCFEVAHNLGLVNEEHVVVNIQGDEPFIDPAQIERVMASFADASVEIATLAKKIDDLTELLSPNSVKVALGENGQAVYFSRHPVPFARGVDQPDWLQHHTYYKHVGLYAYKASVLKRLVALSPSAIELAESLEQLRWLAHGFKISIELTDIESQAVDIPEDLLKFNPKV